MLKQQRYVSDELTHFVGAKLPSSESRYDLLVKILKSGVLKIPGSSDIVFEQDPEGKATTKVAHTHRVDYGKPLSSNEKYSSSIVCFADIPVEDLPFHTRKYSPFGLSFSKRFLVGRGASPVFYIAEQSSTNWRNPLANDPGNFEKLEELTKKWRNRGNWQNFTRAELYDTADQTLGVPIGSPSAYSPHAAGPDTVTLREFLTRELFPFLKFFDADLSEEDERNYYMEREWRVIGPVNFSVENVERILLPRAFAPNLRSDFPDFHGQVNYIA